MVLNSLSPRAGAGSPVSSEKAPSFSPGTPFAEAKCTQKGQFHADEPIWSNDCAKRYKQISSSRFDQVVLSGLGGPASTSPFLGSEAPTDKQPPCRMPEANLSPGRRAGGHVFLLSVRPPSGLGAFERWHVSSNVLDASVNVSVFLRA